MTNFVMAIAGFAGIVIASMPDDIVPFPMRVIGFLVCWSIGFGAGMLAHRRRKAANNKLPVISVRARVVSRRIAIDGYGKTRRKVWYLTFQTQEDQFIEFEVSEIEYGRFEDGEAGTLEYRGREYLGMCRYDLGDMKPVVQPDQPETLSDGAELPSESAGILTHEIEA